MAALVEVRCLTHFYVYNTRGKVRIIGVENMYNFIRNMSYPRFVPYTLIQLMNHPRKLFPLPPPRRSEPGTRTRRREPHRRP